MLVNKLIKAYSPKQRANRSQIWSLAGLYFRVTGGERYLHRRKGAGKEGGEGEGDTAERWERGKKGGRKIEEEGRERGKKGK